MPEPVLIQPDAAFIRDVIETGGGDLKKCFQCATCSAVCTLSPEDAPFPRKQMIEAQWGLKEHLAGDPAVWLCHNCGDCTTNCPRGARPGDVLGAVRSALIRAFSFPRFMGSLLASPKWLPLLYLLPVIIFGAIALLGPKAVSTASPEFAELFPIPILEALFFTVSGLVVIVLAVGLTRFIRALRAAGCKESILKGLAPAVADIATHKRFRKCSKEQTRSWGHLLTFWGFVGLAVMGTAVGIGTMAGIMHTPLALTSPWKVFANVCAAVVFVGCVMLLVDRVRDPEKRASSTYFDWFFLLTLAGVVFTGILSETLRLGSAVWAMYTVYFVHLVLIFTLFLYAPYSKFAHFLYRTVAMAAAGKGT
ncbi:MAG: quinone-interacting membrane-bound oxidoreductase complex subunit QmoC [Acidobacteriota bacterium]|jgi:quinone-modifying oxidoreductase, subunit QmoC